MSLPFHFARGVFVRGGHRRRHWLTLTEHPVRFSGQTFSKRLCMAGLLACGSSRVTNLPGFPVAFWWALSAYSRGGGCGSGPLFGSSHSAFPV